MSDSKWFSLFLVILGILGLYLESKCALVPSLGAIATKSGSTS